MKMTDYPCLYRLCETEHSTQCDFFCGLSTIFGMDVPAIIEHSILFAHTSQGVLFKGKGFCAEDIEQFGKKRLERPFSDCITLSSAFSDYDIKNEACRICKLSSTFKNQWIDEERILLSFILQKGTDTNSEELLWNLQEKDFCSVCYLATGKSLRTYPLITFNQYLFKYLKALPSLENLERDELVNNFVPYLHDIIRKSQKKRKIIDITIPTPISISFNTVYDCVMREFSILYSYSPDMLTVTQLAKSKTLVKDSIKAGYVPPRIKHGTIDDTISSVISPVNTTETKHPRYHNSHSSGALFQMNICDMLNIETQTPSPVSILTFHSNDTSPQEDAVMDTHTPPNTMVEFPPAILQNESMAIYRITAKFNTTNTMTSDASLVILPNDISSDLSDNMPQNTPQTIATNNNNVYNPDSNDCTDDSKKIPATLVKVIECTTDDTKFDLICDTHTTDFDVMLEDSHNKEDTSIDEENILNTLHEPSNFLPSTLIADNLETHKKSKMTIDLQLSDIEQTNETISGLCNSCEYSDYIDYPNSTTNIFKTYYNNNTKKQKYTTPPFKAFDCSSYFIGNTCKILFPNYNIKNTFVPTIIDCSIEDMHHIHSFLIDSCSSTTICIEAIQFNLRSGLLFYMPCSGKFYFFDINFTFSNFLQPILSTATKTRFLSIHSIPVYFMLSKLGFKHIYIESLINLFTCINEINYNIPFSMLFQLILNINQPKEQDFYQFAMPLYLQLFEKLHTPVKAPSGYSSNLLTHYRNMNYFNHALSTAYDLSDVILELNSGVSGLNQYNYILHYQEDKPIISHGILYSVTFPFIDSTDNTKDSLCHTIISSVYALPYKCISHAKLLSVSHSGIMFFCTEDGDEFFDLLLNAARKVYKNMFKKIPIINTKKIIY